jgi:hypothetical protein
MENNRRGKVMLKFLRRLFANAAPQSNVEHLGGGGHTRRDDVNYWLRQSGLQVEKNEPPIPDIVQVASHDVISAIFRADAERQRIEFETRPSRRVVNDCGIAICPIFRGNK